MKAFNTAIKSYWEALKFISANRLGGYFIVPLIINFFLFWAGLELISQLSESITIGISTQINEWVSDFEALNFIKTILNTIIWISLKVLYLLLYAFIGGYMVMITMSPLLAYLSEKTESILTEVTYKFNLIKILKDAGRGVLIASRNFAIELALTLLLLILSFIPVVNLFTPFLLFIVTAYYYGFSFMDYSNERRKPSLKKGIKFIRKNKAATTGIGVVFNLILIIPILGVFLGSFLSIVAVIAATMTYIKIDDQS